MLVALFMGAINAYSWEQKEFMIGKLTMLQNGFGSWDVSLTGYGNITAIPVPADYDGDGKADLCTVTSTANLWQIDYAQDGFNGYDNIKTNPLASESNVLPWLTTFWERVTLFEGC